MLLALLLFGGWLDVPRPATAATIDPRIFAGKSSGEPASFLVLLRDQADISMAAEIGDRVERRRYVYETLRAHADASQKPLGERLRQIGIRFRSHYLVNMLEVEGNRPIAEELSARAEVAAIAANVGKDLARPAPSQVSRRMSREGIEPNIEKVRAPEIWDRGFTGQGIVVGIADTGIEWEHPALKNQYRGWNGSTVSHDYNWHDAIHDALPGNPCGSDAPAPCDDDGHGTGVSGLVVGDDGAGNRIGVAPGARFIGCRNMDRDNGTPARYTECFEFFLAPTDSSGENPRPDLAADVINNSWACPESEGCTDPGILTAVVENVRAAGIVVVVAAGNSGATCSTIDEVPAIYEASFTIGATALDDAIAGFSSLGPVTVDGSNRLKPDLAAPGLELKTAALGGGYQLNFSGTSAAAPHVAGAVALLWSGIPSLGGDVDATEEFLELGAMPLIFPITCGAYSGTEIPNPVFGWGRLDVASAFDRAASRLAPTLPAGRAGTRVLPFRD